MIANIYFFLGQVLASNDQKEEAIKMVNRAIELGEKIDSKGQGRALQRTKAEG